MALSVSDSSIGLVFFNEYWQCAVLIMHVSNFSASEHYVSDTRYGPVSVLVCYKMFHQTDGVIELVFGTKASFDLSFFLLSRNSGISTHKSTSLRNFVPNSGLRKFRHGKSIVWSTKLNDGRARWPHWPQTARTVYYTSNDRNDLTSFDLLWIYCTTSYYRCAADNEISTDIARRTVTRSPCTV